ncbi:hypothetical protein [Priestia megaterium]|uniref:hypothetical protein n=1 Tax=Priestia megaterium TaxID=1404 RepID=UPI003CC6A758
MKRLNDFGVTMAELKSTNVFKVDAPTAEQVGRAMKRAKGYELALEGEVTLECDLSDASPEELNALLGGNVNE